MDEGILDNNKNIDFIELVYQNVQNMIILADNKANYTLSIQAIILGLGIGYYLNKDVMGQLSNINVVITVICIVLIILFLLSSILGIIYSIKVYFPQKPHNNKEEKRNGLSYFGHITAYTSSEKYLEKIRNLSNDIIIEELGNQIYTLSYIANEKMNNIKIAIILLLLSIISLTILFILSIFT